MKQVSLLALLLLVVFGSSLQIVCALGEKNITACQECLGFDKHNRKNIKNPEHFWCPHLNQSCISSMPKYPYSPSDVAGCSFVCEKPSAKPYYPKTPYFKATFYILLVSCFVFTPFGFSLLLCNVKCPDCFTHCLEIDKYSNDSMTNTVHIHERHWQETISQSRLKHRTHVGLAFSGGGIRSASFSLGFLDYLAKHRSKLWLRISHMSSVSGGGYTATGFWSHLHVPEEAPISPDLPQTQERDSAHIKNFQIAVESLKKQVLLRSNYLGLPAFIRILCVILTSIIGVLFTYNLVSFTMGYLVSAVCSCGTAKTCGASAFPFSDDGIWLCPNFDCTDKGCLQNESKDVSPRCADSSFVLDQIQYLFSMTQRLGPTMFFFTATFLIIHTALYPALTRCIYWRPRLPTRGQVNREGYEEIEDFEAHREKQKDQVAFGVGRCAVKWIWIKFVSNWGLPILAGACVVVFLLAFVWDLLIAMTLASVFFEKWEIPFAILFAISLLLIISTALSQMAHPALVATGYFFGAISVIYLAIGLPAWYATLCLCYFTTVGLQTFQCTATWSVLIYQLFLPFFGDSINAIYRRGLVTSFFKDGQSIKFSGMSENEYRPFLIVNCCSHGSKDGEPYVATPLYHGKELRKKKGKDKEKIGPYFSSYGRDLSLFMSASAAAVTPRAGRIKFSLLASFLLSLLDINMGVWFSFPGKRAGIVYALFTLYLGTLFPLWYLSFPILAIDAFSIFNLLIICAILVFLLLILLPWFFGKTVVKVLSRESIGSDSKLTGRLFNLINVRGSFAFRSFANFFKCKSRPPLDPILLTDGGHFENLALHPLILRKCPIIICLDGAEDDRNSDLFRCFSLLRDKFTFVNVDPENPASNDFFTTKISKNSPPPIDVIRYTENADPTWQGYILHLKMTFPEDMPPTIANFFNVFNRKRHGAADQPFALDPTSDQFFDETKTQAYMDLAMDLCQRYLDPALKKVLKEVKMAGTTAPSSSTATSTCQTASSSSHGTDKQPSSFIEGADTEHRQSSWNAQTHFDSDSEGELVNENESTLLFQSRSSTSVN